MHMVQNDPLQDIVVSELSSIHEIDRSSWNELVDQFGICIFHRYEWLSAYEASYPHKAVKSVHHLIGQTSSGELIALLPLFHTQKCPYWLSMAAEIGHSSDIFSKPYLASHSWYAFYSDVIGDRSSEKYGIFIKKAVEHIDDICERLAIPYSCFTAIRPTDSLSQLLQNEGYRPFNIMNNTVLDLQTSDFDEYVKGLSSYNMRHNIKRYSQRLMEAGIRKDWLMNPSREQVITFYDLLVETYRRHSGVDLTDPVETISSIFTEMPENAGLIILRNDDSWIAAALCFVHKNIFTACYPGMMMSESLRPLNLRLNLYCASIEQALKLNCTHMEFGRTGYEFKAKLGIKKNLTHTLVKAYGNAASEIYDSFSKLEERV